MEVGDVLEVSGSRCLWKVVAIGPWPASSHGPGGGTMVTTEHAQPEDRAKWPGFQDRNGIEVQEALSTVLESKPMPCGCVWVILTDESPVECDAADSEGRGWVRVEIGPECGNERKRG